MSFSKELTKLLKNPVFDKVAGIIVILPSFFLLYYYYMQIQHGTFDWYHLAIAANVLVCIGTTLTRRTAVRVSLNPFYWLVTLLRTFWAFIILLYVYSYGHPALAPVWFTDGLLVLSMALIVYSRLSLGRNIGFIPAKRKLVTTGAYSYVRHPIHTAELIYFFSFMLVSYTPFNFFLLLLGFVFIIGKTLIEERFFKDDKEYQEFKKKVPYMWIPGVI